MRVISGSARGKNLESLEGLSTRPTIDRVKEGIFSSIQFLVPGARVLDLFAGTGAVGFEFASRGAASVTSVEINAVHYNFIRTTAKSFGLTNIHPVKANVFLYLKSCAKKYDIIFSDAPYDLEGSEQVVDMVLENGLLKEDGIFIFEHSKDKDFSQHPRFSRLRSYGSVQFSIFE